MEITGMTKPQKDWGWQRPVEVIWSNPAAPTRPLRARWDVRVSWNCCECLYYRGSANSLQLKAANGSQTSVKHLASIIICGFSLLHCMGTDTVGSWIISSCYSKERTGLVFPFSMVVCKSLLYKMITVGLRLNHGVCSAKPVDFSFSNLDLT